MKQSLDYLDGFLEDWGTPYACGDRFTIADLSILATITVLDALDYNYKFYGELTRYINRLKVCLFTSIFHSGKKAHLLPTPLVSLSCVALSRDFNPRESELGILNELFYFL